MPTVIYELSDGSVHEIDVPAGQSVMDGSVRNNLPGIVAECGGSCSCATCHVFLDEGDSGRFDAPSDEERDLLEFAEGAQPNSRLSCQLIVGAGCPAVRVVVPDTNG
ncbi:2Fe-2S iron-sulfur cluster binding domain-containing protein [Nakamurella sp. YIM 132087]|uniref:2Fe-2S iron-sulfur cluster binding domain-containing protein n=1 Tax=Nakamurella alba TaxID=2665158 RepID=A0A7K1FEJ4_9ACTN|nr:2Fe-2S iron-sulfur cluster-binding protein [Nakamurella alba]MTD12518.1 2Fe-2S iron-sulfur cluster binding domain-containing protein [Nakamurella alba]